MHVAEVEEEGKPHRYSGCEHIVVAPTLQVDHEGGCCGEVNVNKNFIMNLIQANKFT